MREGEECKEINIKITLPDGFPPLIPDDTKKHVLKAEKEMLLAFKSLIDARVADIEGNEGGTKEKMKKIDVE